MIERACGCCLRVLLSELSVDIYDVFKNLHRLKNFYHTVRSCGLSERFGCTVWVDGLLPYLLTGFARRFARFARRFCSPSCLPTLLIAFVCFQSANRICSSHRVWSPSLFTEVVSHLRSTSQCLVFRTFWHQVSCVCTTSRCSR